MFRRLRRWLLLRRLKKRQPPMDWASTRATIVGTLKRIGPEEAAGAVVKWLKHKDAKVRDEAACVLGLLGVRAAAPALLDACHDKNSDVRYEVAKALGILGDRRAVGALVAMLEEGEAGYVARQIAQALGKLEDAAAAPALIKLLNDEEVETRECAAEALGALGGDEALEPLRKAMAHAEGSVHARVVEAFRAVRQKSASCHLLCRGCFKRLTAKKALAGKNIKCPGCAQLQRVPTPEERTSAQTLVERAAGGLSEQTLADFNQAMQLDPGNAKVYEERGWFLYHKGDVAGAIADYDRAIWLDPTHSKSFVQRAAAHNRLEQHDKALADVTRFIQLEPKAAYAYELRALIHASLGDQTKSESDRATAQQINFRWDIVTGQAAFDEGVAAGVIDSHLCAGVARLKPSCPVQGTVSTCGTVACAGCASEIRFEAKMSGWLGSFGVGTCPECGLRLEGGFSYHTMDGVDALFLYITSTQRPNMSRSRPTLSIVWVDLT
jgi:tetratricopeptide (TPR) repeat protein